MLLTSRGEGLAGRVSQATGWGRAGEAYKQTKIRHTRIRSGIRSDTRSGGTQDPPALVGGASLP